MTEFTRAAWSAAMIDDLTDSSFLYIEEGGSKDSGGKTTPRSLRHFPVKDASGNVDLPHLRDALSRIPQSDISPADKAAATSKAEAMLKAENGRSEEFPPRDSLVRTAPSLEVIRSSNGSSMPVLHGRAAVFNEWTEIDSKVEGHFYERFSPGAFAKTISERRDQIRCLFNHGLDPSIGMKPLGPIIDLSERGDGVHYEVQLLDTDYNRSLIPGLEAGLYGSSHRFGIVRKNDERKRVSNPKGILERTISEAYLREFGPTPFPAYGSTSAGIRSLTDEFVLGRFPTEALIEQASMRADRDTLAEMRELGQRFMASGDTDADAMQGILTAIEALRAETADQEGDEESPDAPSTDEAALTGTSRRSAATPSSKPLWGASKEKPSWQL